MLFVELFVEGGFVIWGWFGVCFFVKGVIIDNVLIIGIVSRLVICD